jgi:hypothetical protein
VQQDLRVVHVDKIKNSEISDVCVSLEYEEQDCNPIAIVHHHTYAFCSNHPTLKKWEATSAVDGYITGKLWMTQLASTKASIPSACNGCAQSSTTCIKNIHCKDFSHLARRYTMQTADKHTQLSVWDLCDRGGVVVVATVAGSSSAIGGVRWCPEKHV